MKADLRRWVPEWWRGRAGALGAVIDVAAYPLEFGFRSAAAARNGLYRTGFLPAQTAGVPVVSVGNLTVGGTGKTPVTSWVAARLDAWGMSPAIVMRGYGGDEAAVHLELNPLIPVYSAPRRAAGAEAAIAHGARSIVLDDGFQHRALRRDLDVVLVSAEQWSGNRKLLPRGPWREPLGSLRRAGFVLVTRKVASPDHARRVLARLEDEGLVANGAIAHLALGRMHSLMVDAGDGAPADSLRGERVLAVSSLAEPESFEEQLRRCGAVVESMIFSDHHAFDGEDARAIVAKADGRALVMTRKEAVKLRGLLPATVTAYVLGQEVVFESGREEMERVVRKSIGERNDQRA